MLDVVIFLVLAVILIGVEVLFRDKEAGVSKTQRIATAQECEVSLSNFDLRMRLSLVGLNLAVLVLLTALGAILMLLFYTSALIGVRYGLFVLFREHASNCKRLMLFTALQKPNVQKAELVFYFSGIDLESPQHFNMWKEPIDKLGRPWFVILREEHHLPFFNGDNMPPAVLILDDMSLHGILPASVKLAFYANNAQRNRMMVAAYPKVKHVQLLHGDSDKPPSYSALTKIYDFVFVAGQMAIDRYKNHGVYIPQDRFRIVGRPQLAAIDIDPERTISPTGQVIGYMPTWRGFFEDTQFSSLDRADEIIQTIRDTLPTARVVFKPHPMSYKDPKWKEYKAAIQSTLGPLDRFDDQTTVPFDIYNEVDALICDISSVMLDYLYSGKPLIVVLPANFSAMDASQYPSLSAAYEVSPNLENLAAVLTKATDDDTLRYKRTEVQQAALGDFGRTPGEAFHETCLAFFDESKS